MDIQKIKEAAEKELSCSAHGLDHSMRVYNLALLIAENSDVDLEVLQAAALLHDIGGEKEMTDPTGQTDHALVGAEMAGPILRRLDFPEEKIQHVQDCIVSHRSKTDKTPQTKEAQILFEADKLDAFGAIGVARHFIWVGKNNANMYKKVNIEEYARDNLSDGRITGRIKDKTQHSPQIEFEIKIKHLLNKIKTPRAIEIGKEKIEFFKAFLDQLEKEFNGG